jgi:hypothetical protein
MRILSIVAKNRTIYINLEQVLYIECPDTPPGSANIVMNGRDENSKPTVLALEGPEAALFLKQIDALLGKII